MRRTVWLAFAAAACSGTASRGGQAPEPPAVAAGAVAVVPPEDAPPRAIAPGVLRAHLTAGALVVDAAPAPAVPLRVRLEVCVGVDGAVATTLARASGDDAYDRAVIDAVAGWRFAPFAEGGAVCSDAVFVSQAARAADQ